MTQTKMNRIAPPGLSRTTLLALGTALLGGVAWNQSASAQGASPRLLVSTTADVQASSTLPYISDASLVAVGGTDGVRPHFVDGHWLGTTGFVPSDIDAHARMGGQVPGRNTSNLVSLLSNEHGFEDGDVLMFGDSGGFVVLVSEDQLVAGLGLTTEEIDVDAICFDDLDRLLFSLQADVSGTTLGTVEDGDVLRYTANGVVERVFTEAEIQTMFDLATGGPGSIGDVQGIEFVNGELWVATQGPSTHDGAVLSCATVPYIVADEAALGLEGAEIDALSILQPGDEIPTLRFDMTQAYPGDTFHAELHGAPSSLQFVLMAGNTGFIDFAAHPGWGAAYMSLSDPWLTQILSAPTGNFLVLDALGERAVDYALPTASLWGIGFGAEEGWSFQMVDLATLELSAPFRVEKL